MDDRSLKEYAFNIYKGIRGYTLNKALSLFPKYYPKIVFYYTEMLTKQQNEFSLRMIQGLGIDKGRALMNELNDLNVKEMDFYINAYLKINRSYRRIEAATDRYNKHYIILQEIENTFQIINQTKYFLNKGLDLLTKIIDTSKKYNYQNLLIDAIKAADMNNKLIDLIYKENRKFTDYIKQYQYKE